VPPSYSGHYSGHGITFVQNSVQNNVQETTASAPYAPSKLRTRPTIILDAIQAAWSASILVATGTAIIYNANEQVAERRFILSALEKALFVNGTSKNRMELQ